MNDCYLSNRFMVLPIHPLDIMRASSTIAMVHFVCVFLVLSDAAVHSRPGSRDTIFWTGGEAL